jgi:hypothetical protein
MDFSLGLKTTFAPAGVPLPFFVEFGVERSPSMNPSTGRVDVCTAIAPNPDEPLIPYID